MNVILKRDGDIERNVVCSEAEFQALLEKGYKLIKETNILALFNGSYNHKPWIFDSFESNDSLVKEELFNASNNLPMLEDWEIERIRAVPIKGVYREKERGMDCFFSYFSDGSYRKIGVL